MKSSPEKPFPMRTSRPPSQSRAAHMKMPSVSVSGLDSALKTWTRKAVLRETFVLAVNFASSASFMLNILTTRMQFTVSFMMEESPDIISSERLLRRRTVFPILHIRARRERDIKWPNTEQGKLGA